MLLTKAALIALRRRRKCESCLAVVLDIFVSLGEGSERADFLELVIRAQSLLGWTLYHYF